MKKPILLTLAIIFYNLSYAQIQLNSSGNVGICGTPNSSYGLTVGRSTNMVNTYFYNGVRIYNPYGNDLIIDNTANYGESVHPVSNNSCNVGNSNLVFAYMYSYHFTNPSDRRQKENIRNIPDALGLVLKLTGIKYDLKKEFAYNETSIKSANIKAKLEALRKNQIGFIAQDVNTVLPEVVTHDDSTDIYAIDYSKVVPVLVEAIKEQQLQIDSLKQANKGDSETLKNAKVSKVTEETGNTTDKPYLEQNAPNPFNVATTINFYIPQSNQNAAIYIYDMQGLQKKVFTITSKGKASIAIYGSELQAGMYLYTLIVDGKEVDTKKMILTD